MMMKLSRSAALAVVLAIAGGLFWSGLVLGEPETTKTSTAMVYELRTYTTVPGRMPALHKRFRDHTMKLFEKHGMTNVIYWVPVDDENTLVYVLAHKSVEAAKESFDAFRKDPEWIKAKAESEQDGPIVLKVVSQFLTPTEYSPKK